MGKVPGPAGTTFLPTMDPAMARAGMIIRKRPPSIARASTVFHEVVFAFSPPKAEPLFPVALVNA